MVFSIVFYEKLSEKMIVFGIVFYEKLTEED